MITNFLNETSEDGDAPGSGSGIGVDRSGLGMSNSKRNKKAFEGYLKTKILLFLFYFTF